MDVWQLSYISLLMVSAVLVIGFALVVRGLSGSRGGERLVERLRCPRCGYSFVRAFQEGDYVGKLSDYKCPRCGARMVVEAVYLESTEPLAVRLFSKRRPSEKLKNTSTRVWV